MLKVVLLNGKGLLSLEEQGFWLKISEKRVNWNKTDFVKKKTRPKSHSLCIPFISVCKKLAKLLDAFSQVCFQSKKFGPKNF